MPVSAWSFNSWTYRVPTDALVGRRQRASCIKILATRRANLMSIRMHRRSSISTARLLLRLSQSNRMPFCNRRHSPPNRYSVTIPKTASNGTGKSHKERLSPRVKTP